MKRSQNQKHISHFAKESRLKAEGVIRRSPPPHTAPFGGSHGPDVALRVEVALLRGLQEVRCGGGKVAVAVLQRRWGK